MLLGYDVSNVANIQASVYHAFGHVELLTWVAIGYTALNVCMMPLCRRLSAFGNLKVQFYIYTLIFAAGAAIAGAAPDINCVIIGRAITGIGGAGLYQGIMLYNFKFSSAYEAPRGQAVIGTGFAIGLVLGPIVGGAFAENPHATWRWAMFINIPILAVLCAGWKVFLPPLFISKQAASHTWVNVDWLGWILHCASFLMLFSSLIFSGSHWPWDSYSAIVAWVFAGLLFSLYAAQQHFCIWTTRKHRIFPADALGEVRTVLPVGLSTTMAAAAYGITLYYTPLFFSFTRGFDPVEAAVHLLPYIGTFVGMTVLSSALLPHLRVYPVLYVLGGALMIIGGALQTSMTADSPVGFVMGNLALVGAGVGLIFQQGAAVLKTLARGDATKESDHVVVFLIMQLGGVALFMSVGGCIFQNLGFKYVNDALVDAGVRISDAEVRQALGGLDSAFLGQADQGLARVVVGEISRAIGNTFFIVVGVGAVVFCLAFVMKWERLDFKPKPVATELSGP
ncbi:hypothetical protein MCOR05_011552 [Pyricularia oryzae]|nr:hypothetical protein MCOR05_011552 [Pyricularia oryzae]